MWAGCLKIDCLSKRNCKIDTGVHECFGPLPMKRRSFPVGATSEAMLGGALVARPDAALVLPESGFGGSLCW